MEEYLHPKEEALLACLRSNYLSSMSVTTTVSKKECFDCGITTAWEAGEVLKALMIREYIYFNAEWDHEEDSIYHKRIKIKEKALNYFNKKE